MPQAPFTRESFKSWVSVPVRWGDMDAMGHVNNANYITYLESARIHLFAELGMERPMDQSQLGFALVSVTCNFRQQVHYPATLEVGTAISRIGDRSFHMVHGMFPAGEEQLVADAASITAWVDYGQGKSISLPDAMRARLAERLIQQ